jgi:hypothetical protein
LIGLRLDGGISRAERRLRFFDGAERAGGEEAKMADPRLVTSPCGTRIGLPSTLA